MNILLHLKDGRSFAHDYCASAGVTNEMYQIGCEGTRYLYPLTDIFRVEIRESDQEEFIKRAEHLDK